MNEMKQHTCLTPHIHLITNVDALQRIWEGLVVALLQPLLLLLEAPAMIQILNLHCLRTTRQFSLGESIYSRKLFAINLFTTQDTNRLAKYSHAAGKTDEIFVVSLGAPKSECRKNFF